MNKQTVLVIEGDAAARMAVVEILGADEGIEVVGIASDPMLARMQIKLRKPDVLVLAIDKETGSADAFLTELMQNSPRPVVMLSSKILPGSDAERQMIKAKLASILVKPANGVSAQDLYFAKRLVEQVQQIAEKQIAGKQIAGKQIAEKQGAVVAAKPTVAAQKTVSTQAPVPAASSTAHKRHNPDSDTLIAIGASTGGTEALRHVVSKFAADAAAVVIVQHIPKAFAASFIKQLDRSSAMQVIAVEDGAEIRKGHIYVGACDQHFSIEKNGAGFVCRLGGQEKVSGHCPSVDVLFDSVAECAGAKAVGALMTGMGDDGASGLKKMRDAKAKTVAQDKESSVVWGMPGVAVKIGAAEEQVHLDQLGDRLIQLALVK
ncbi:MAG: chemotaxis protein CheB [Mariprofundus sp.]